MTCDQILALEELSLNAYSCPCFGWNSAGRSTSPCHPKIRGSQVSDGLRPRSLNAFGAGAYFDLAVGVGLRSRSFEHKFSFLLQRKEAVAVNPKTLLGKMFLRACQVAIMVFLRAGMRLNT